MDRSQFDHAIGKVPPSTVDVDAVIARGRRAAWVRRVATPWASAAAGVVAVTVGVMALLPDGDVGGAPAGPPTSTEPSPSTQPPTPTCTGGIPAGPPAPEAPAAAATRLTGVLTAAVSSRLAPGSQLEANPAAEYPAGTPHGPLQAYRIFSTAHALPDGSCQGGEDYFLAMATVVRQAEKGNVMAVLSRAGGNASPQTECTDSGTVVDVGAQCEKQSGPGGETILVSTLTLDSGPTVHQVDISKPDGTGIILYAENVAVQAKQGGPPDSRTPPLSHQQLIDIGLAPGMTLYP